MKKNTVTPEQIEDIIANSEIKAYKLFDKTSVVACKLPNGFVIVESSSCVDPANFDEVLGYEICMQRIRNKVWELEGYDLQKEVYENGKGKEIPVSDSIH